jgi:hypothetical protein
MKTSLTINLFLCLALMAGWYVLQDVIRYKDYLSKALAKERDARYGRMMSHDD